jgi:RNA methyltransferase, TrmH family
MKIKRYNKKNDISYSFGAYTVMSLIEKKEDSVVKVLFKEEGLKSTEVLKVLNIVKEKDIPFEINDRLIEKISYKENTYVVGVLKKYSCNLEKDEKHIVLINPTNPGNIGNIMRSMVAFNVKNLAIVKPAIDIFYPKVIRSSMGAFFNVNWKYFENFETYVREFPNNNVFTFTKDGKQSLDGFSKNFSKERNISLVFGNESRGIGENIKKFGKSVFIPQSKDIESLNLSVSVGITLYSLKNENVDKIMDK